ncbi:uncharacterized protein LOC144677601 [Cetorhinus maximus]
MARDLRGESTATLTAGSPSDPAPGASRSGPSLIPLMPQEAETAQQVLEKVLGLVREHPEGLSVFQLRRAYARTYNRPLNPLGYTTLKELLQRMPDGVCLRGLGVQARVYPYSAVEASQGGLHPSTWMDTGPHSIGLSLGSTETETSDSRGTGSPEAGNRADEGIPAREPGPGSPSSFPPLLPHLPDPRSGLPLPSPWSGPALRLGGCPASPGPAYSRAGGWAPSVRRAPPTPAAFGQCPGPSAPTPWGLLARPGAPAGLQGGLGGARLAYFAPWGLYHRRPPAGYLLPQPEEDQKPCSLL